MATNIVTEIIGLVAPAALDRIAAALGLNGDAAKKALGTAVPALLAALGTKAASPAGARALFDAVSQADPDVFGKLSSALTGAKSEKFVQGGMGALTSLFGDNVLSGLTGAVAKQAGLGGNASSSLMAIAGQLAMGSLAKSAKSSGLDASGLAGLLNSQQGNIKAALPAGLGELLAGAGVVGSSFAGQATQVASQAGRAASATASQAAASTKKGTNWLTWLVPVILIAAALWYFLGQGSKPTVTTETGGTPPAVTEILVDGVDVGKQVTTALDGLKGVLGGITDTATAQAALPKLQETVTSIDGISGLVGKLSAEQKTAVAALVSAALPAIKETANKVLAIQGVGDLAKPVVDSLIAKIEALAKPA
jgi:Bacterial protein of unknown function (DUF937)